MSAFGRRSEISPFGAPRNPEDWRVHPLRMGMTPSARTRPSRAPAAERAAEIFHRPPRDWPEPAPSDDLRIHAPPTKPEPPTGGMVHAMFPPIGSFGLLAFPPVYP